MSGAPASGKESKTASDGRCDFMYKGILRAGRYSWKVKGCHGTLVIESASSKEWHKVFDTKPAVEMIKVKASYLESAGTPCDEAFVAAVTKVRAVRDFLISS